MGKGLKAKAWQQDNWEPLGALSDAKKTATYKFQSFIEEIDGRKYRFIVVHFSVLDGRKARSLEKKLSEKHRLKTLHRVERIAMFMQVRWYLYFTKD